MSKEDTVPDLVFTGTEEGVGNSREEGVLSTTTKDLLVSWVTTLFDIP